MSPPPTGRLLLVPNALDTGTAPAALPDLREVLPLGVIREAARLGHWAVESAKSARAFLKRVDAIEPLRLPLQQLEMRELPRPPKGGGAPAPGADDAAWRALLAPALAGADLGLLSEAGLPAVADPGARLVALAHDAGITVCPLPGPSSLLLALAASGLDGQHFAFVGYLPVDAAARAARIRELQATSRRLGQTQLMIETPYRNAALLASLLQHLEGTTRLGVACGLTLAGAWTHASPVARWRDSSALPAALREGIPADVPAVFALLAR